MPIAPEVVVALLSALGAITTAGIKGVWVWGRELRKAERDGDFWRDIALRSMGLTDAAIEVVKKKSGDG